MKPRKERNKWLEERRMLQAKLFEEEELARALQQVANQPEGYVSGNHRLGALREEPRLAICGAHQAEETIPQAEQEGAVVGLQPHPRPTVEGGA